MSERIYQRRQRAGEVAVELGVAEETVRRMVRQGAPCDRLGRNIVRLNVDELRAWMAQREAARAAGGAR